MPAQAPLTPVIVRVSLDPVSAIWMTALLPVMLGLVVFPQVEQKVLASSCSE